jgi:hypothetical protein
MERVLLRKAQHELDLAEKRKGPDRKDSSRKIWP